MKNNLNRSVVDESGTVWYIQPGGNRQRASVRTCLTCKSDFASYPNGKSDFCSIECVRKACKRCSKGFAPETNRQVYCSPACKQKWAECEECSNEFRVGKGSQGRFCSALCFYTSQCPVGSVRPGGGGYLIIKVAPETPGSRRGGFRGHWMLHHRYVMQQKLGRALKKNENVHHINGDRSDNRPENLELWKRSQPAGVRSADYHCPGCRCGED